MRSPFSSGPFSLRTPLSARLVPQLPPGLGWDDEQFPLPLHPAAQGYAVDLDPRALVDPAVWSGPAIHVDIATGDDGNSGLGAQDGDFSAAVKTIHAAFTAGNATGGAYRVLVKSGFYKENHFTNNGAVEPDQPVALVAWGGRVLYRTGPENPAFAFDQGTTYSTSLSSTQRVFRTDVTDAQGRYQELSAAADLAACRATAGTFFKDGSTVYVNIGADPDGKIALIRSIHGARFLTHAEDFYIEGFDIEGGITGAFHMDAAAARNVICDGCTFRYSATGTPGAQQDAFRVLRTNGLVWARGCDAAYGAKDNWNFHENGTPGMHVLLEACTGGRPGWDAAASCNDFTTHDGVTAAAISCSFEGGGPRPGSTVHCIETARSWLLDCRIQADDSDGDGQAIALSCSNDASMWLEGSSLQALGAAQDNIALRANGGQIFLRRSTEAGTRDISAGGSISGY
ncbi:hypothetical protein [Leisingera thetidis]|uniref:hypothetical protein n=1 Tax=Leisingera thetidis TaxID=2930199 RepID=UPI0021F7AE49|nr:hypothetical protein [Leisingera thetidis]